MKKSLLFIVSIIVSLCFVFAGCDLFSEKSSFKIVSYVKLVSGGKQVKYTSRAVLMGGHAWAKKEEASRYEYENADILYRVHGESFLNDLDLDTTKTIKSFRGLTNDDIGRYVYWGVYSVLDEDRYLEYYKYKFSGWEYEYLHVKVINDTKLVVYVDPLSEEQATTYEVTSYSIGNELK